MNTNEYEWKPARLWISEVQHLPQREDIELLPSQSGEPTLRVGNVFLHSRYRPQEEATRLIESADLDPAKPVLVVGLGLGYHVLELQRRGFNVAVVEPDPAVAKQALAGPMAQSDILLGLGEVDTFAASTAFRMFAAREPQVWVHPPSGRLNPAFAERVTAAVAAARFQGQRLGVAVVGPMYGGSLPIAGYLERAFRALGHRTLLVDNAMAWPLYQEMERSVSSRKAKGQLGAFLANVLNEWCYARVTEFSPNICIVLAQAPVGPQFPARLAKEDIVTAFWFVENWKHMDYWREIAPHYDAFFHIQPGAFERKLDEVGCPHHAFVQTGCDPEIHRPVELSAAERNEFGCDLSFAGAGYHNRVQVFQGLTDYDFKIWGVDWNTKELQRLVCRPDMRFTPEQFAKIVAGSKINLNLHSSASHPGIDPSCDAINPRVFEIAACGGFQLCDPCAGLAEHFDFGSELPTYRSLPELRERIDHYLAHPEERQQIAQRARERALRDHTYTRRAQQMLDAILERHAARIAAKGVHVQRTMSEMAQRVGRETPLGQYLSTLPPDAIFTQESINNQLGPAREDFTQPEAIFAYLRQMRAAAEDLLASAE